jgi:predicted Ser/Thr protein kinase
MPVLLDAATERALIEWIEQPARAAQTPHGRGYQGTTYRYDAGGRRLLIKVALGRGMRGWFSRWTLQREYQAYRRLDDFAGSPRCYGLLRKRYLVLDYIDALPLRQATIIDRPAFFDALLHHIQELHRRGVAHADLKRKDNLLAIDGRRPCLIDFGAAIVRKPGFAPLNHWLYALARRFDYNAWAKLKYDGRYEEMTPQDRAYYQRSAIEKIARTVKRWYLTLKRQVSG